MPRSAFSAPGTLARYFLEVGRHTLLSADEESRLARATASGDPAARRQMIEANLRLVIRTARRYWRSDLDMADLIEEGNLGLIKALEKFDPDLGHRFSTYAMWWIRQYIERGIMNHGRSVRLPVHRAKQLNRLLRCRRELAQARYREPDARDLASASGLGIDEVRELMPWRDPVCSLTSGGDGDGESWQDSLADPAQRSPEILLGESDLATTVHRFLARLRPREQRILQLRFGFTEAGELTLERIAGEIGVTRERVRQIQIEALARIRRWMQDERLDSDCLGED